MRKELDLERRDLFDAGDGTGAGSKRKHASSQPLGVAQTLALEQEVSAGSRPDKCRRGCTHWHKTVVCQYENTARGQGGSIGASEHWHSGCTHHSKRPRRGPGALSPPPSLVLAKCLGVCARPGCCVCAGPGPGCPDDTRFVRQCVRRPRRPGLGGIAAFAGPVSMFSDDCIAVCRALRPPARASRVSTMLVLCCVVVC